MKKLLIILSSLLLTLTNTFASPLNKGAVDGIYFLGTPERGATKVQLEYGKMGNKTVIAVAACKTCAPAIYSYLTEESQALGVPVFMTSGLYLIRYDDDSFVLVQPDALLGKKAWTSIKHANIYSKSGATAKTTNREKIEKYSIALSSKIMNQKAGVMAHSAGTYYLAVPQKHMGKSYDKYHIDFNTKGKKTITISPCERCPTLIYTQMPEESAITGVDVYHNAPSYYLFDLKDGVLLYTHANASGLGKHLWGKHSTYNVYSNNRAYIRQILNSKEKQDAIDVLMAGFFKAVRDEYVRRADEAEKMKVAARTLPDEALVYTDKKSLLQAAQAWATTWNWKEKLQTAYLIQADWSITRNPLTGIITGKRIGGVVTMRHPDGRCRYQGMSFMKDYDGSQYMNLHVTGIGPAYDLSCDKL